MDGRIIIQVVPSMFNEYFQFLCVQKIPFIPETVEADATSMTTKIPW